MLFVLAIACHGQATTSATSTESNAVKLGTASVEVSVSGGYDADKLTMSALWTALLDNASISDNSVFLSLAPVEFTRSGDTWSAEIPMELQYKNNVPLRIAGTDGQPIGQIGMGLDQSNSLKIELKIDKDGNITDHSATGGTGIVDWAGKYNAMLDAWATTPEPKDDTYAYCDKYIKWETQTRLPSFIEESLALVPDATDAERRWIANEQTRRYMAGRLMDYEETARNFGECADPATPGPEYYRAFLNLLDYSPLLLDEMLPDLRRFTNALISKLEISPIGDTPVDQWQEGVRAKLSTVMDSPTQTLLDLLTATSYLEQLQEEHRQFTPAQVENIKAFFTTDDMGRLLLSRNENPYPSYAFPTDALIETK